MNYRRDLIISFAIAIFLHVLVGMCADSIMTLRSGSAVPLFKRGESSVSLAFVQPPVVKQEQQEEQSEKQEETLQQVPKEEEHPVEQMTDTADADPLEKGVETFSENDMRLTRPKYPLGSRIRGEEGLVRVKVTVNEYGIVKYAEVAESSGFSALDNSAIEAARNACFISKDKKGPLGSCEIIISFRFELID